MKIAVFPGSFDPITVGHESIMMEKCGKWMNLKERTRG
jgi:phosphopantetheine adenylyltransferase